MVAVTVLASVPTGALGASNGRSPKSASYSVTPKAKMSVRASTVSRRTCSGAMYAGVPMSWSARVMSASDEERGPEPEDGDDGGTESSEGAMVPSSTPASRASPKSSTRTRPSSPMRTLSGLKSR